MRHVCYRSLQITLQTHTGQILIAGEPVSPEPKIFALLLYLMRNSGRIVSKNELLDSVWPQEIVGEGALTRGVSHVRKLLSDDARTPTFVRTVHGRGYEFVPVVSEHAVETGPTESDGKRRPTSSRPPSEETRHDRFVGRQAELAQLGALLRAPAAKGARLILLQGEAGVGKTRLIDEVLRLAEGMPEAHWGRASSVEGVPALSMWRRCLASVAAARSVEAVSQALRDVPIHARRRLLGSQAWVTSPLDSGVAGLGAAGSQLFNGTALGLEELARQGPLLFVFDDLHSADLASLLLLRSVLINTSAPLTMVGALRSPNRGGTSATMRCVLPEICKMSAGGLTLRGFTLAEASDFMRSMSPHRRGVDLIELHRRTGGNPFLLWLGARFGRLSPELHRAVASRLSTLPTDCVELLVSSVDGAELSASIDTSGP